MKSVVTFSDVAFEFPNGRRLFQNLNLTLDSKLTALVGPNGVGKTTLAKLIVGELEPSNGIVKRAGSVSYLRQQLEPPPITVGEFLAGEYEWSKLGEDLLSGIEFDRMCASLSGGQWMRVRLALHLGDSYLILDEPTNNLDREGREAVLNFLRMRPGGALLISHDREALALADEVLELSNQGLAKFGGGWSDYLVAREHERESLDRALEVAKRGREQAFRERTEQIDRQEKRNRRGTEAGARGGLPKILLGARKRRAQVSSGKIDAATLERSNETVREAFAARERLKIDPALYVDLVGEPIANQKLVAAAQDFNVGFRDWVFKRNLTFSWRGPVRVALKGPNGSGKSTLLKVIMGTDFKKMKDFKTRGEFHRGNLRALYLDQSGAALDPRLSVLENARAPSSLSESEVRGALARFLFPGDSVFQKVSELSGGEHLRAALAKGFLAEEKPELLILDEPTNNLDLINIEFLEKLVSQFRGALIVISHDECFLENCALETELSL